LIDPINLHLLYSYWTVDDSDGHGHSTTM